jgi:hypothetical protein
MASVARCQLVLALPVPVVRGTALIVVVVDRSGRQHCDHPAGGCAMPSPAYTISEAQRRASAYRPRHRDSPTANMLPYGSLSTDSLK